MEYTEQLKVYVKKLGADLVDFTDNISLAGLKTPHCFVQDNSRNNPVFGLKMVLYAQEQTTQTLSKIPQKAFYFYPLALSG